MDNKVLLNKATLATRKKNWSEAARFWGALHEKESSRPNVKTLLPLARTLRMSNQLAEAEKAIQVALGLEEGNRNIWQEAAEIATKLQNWPVAISRWGWYTNLSLKNKKSIGAKYYQNYACSLQQAGKYEEARKVIEQALANYSDNIVLKNAQAELKAEQLVTEKQDNGPANNWGVSFPLTVEQVCGCFWQAENELDLINWEVNGIYLWPLVRMQIYYALTQNVGLYDSPHPVHKSIKDKEKLNHLTAVALSNTQSASKQTRFAKNYVYQSQQWPTTFKQLSYGNMTNLKSELKKLLNFFKTSLLRVIVGFTFKRKLKGKSSAILMATRKIQGSELYTEALRSELTDTTILLDRPLGADLKSGALNFDAMVKQFREWYRQPQLQVFDVDAHVKIKEICRFFKERLRYEIPDLSKRMQTTIATFYAVRSGFIALWTAYPIDTLYLTNSYGITIRAAMAAAQDCGAKAVELQHGSISRFHLGYSWPNHPIVPYSPNELWCFGEYWYTEATHLAGNVTGRTIGAPYVKGLAGLAGQTNIEPDPSLVVFTSQGVIGRRLIEWAVKTAIYRQDKRIIYRLHPSEVLEDYEQIATSFEPLPDNFSLSHENPVIFELLAEASIQVGVFSTTLLEGMSLGTKTVVVNLPGAEYMLPVIERKDAIFVETVEKLIEKLDDAPLAQDPNFYYSEPRSRLTSIESETSVSDDQ